MASSKEKAVPIKTNDPNKPSQPQQNGGKAPVTAADPNKPPVTNTATPNGEAKSSATEGTTDGDIFPKEDTRKLAYYDKCQFVFSTYVDDKGLVDYEMLKRKRIDLLNAIREFENIKPLQMLSASTNEKIAMWINAYNTFTLKLIIDNYPIQRRMFMSIFYPDNSIMQIPNAWTKNYFKVMGIEYNLQEIEQEILLQRFEDPRICFALSYATIGGATLRNEVYRPEKLDAQLDDQVRKYLARPEGMQINHDEKTIYLSNIFNTHRESFIKKYGDIKRFRTKSAAIKAFFNFIVNYIPEDQVSCLESDDYTVKFSEYNWRLNAKFQQ